MLSVGCGHTAAFCRAVNARCETPYKGLAPDGVLGVAQFEGDAAFQHMLNVGWRWKVISGSAERKWPNLPRLAQQALNATNVVAGQSNEIEIIALIAELHESNPVWDECIAMAAATAPLDIVNYIGVLGNCARATL